MFNICIKLFLLKIHIFSSTIEKYTKKTGVFFKSTDVRVPVFTN